MDLPGLPPIPAKRYFTIGEVSELCAVKPYVLRYWEQEFSQLRPMKRRGNRRYYQHHEVMLIRRIRELLYEEGFTISGARNRLVELGAPGPGAGRVARPTRAAPGRGSSAAARATRGEPEAPAGPALANPGEGEAPTTVAAQQPGPRLPMPGADELREELMRIRALLDV